MMHSNKINIKRGLIKIICCIIAAVSALSAFPNTVFAFSYYEKIYEAEGETYSEVYAEKLDRIFNGEVSLFSDCDDLFRLGDSLDVTKRYCVAGKLYGWQCYIYAQAIYYYLFGEIPAGGDGVSGYFNESRILLTNEIEVSYEMFRQAGVGFGAYIRTTGNTDGSFNGSNGHSMIVLSYDEDYISLLEANVDGNGLIRISKCSWDSFKKSYVTKRRICHIIQYRPQIQEVLFSIHTDREEYACGDTVNITWDRIAECDEYLVEISHDGNEPEKYHTATQTSLSFGVKETGEYSIKISAFSGEEIIRTCRTSLAVEKKAGTRLTAVYNSAMGADLRFRETEDATHYVIMRKYQGIWSDIKICEVSELESSAGVLRYIDTEVQTQYGKGYIYTVRAASEEDLFTYDSNGLPLYRLEKPVILKAETLEDGTARVKWKKADAHGYELQYSSDSGKTWTSAGFSSDTEMTIRGLSAGEKVVFRIRCFKDNTDRGRVYSQYSEWMRAIQTESFAPVLLKVYNSAKGADVRWELDETDHDYVIMRKDNGVWYDVCEIHADEAEKQDGFYRYIDEEVAQDYGNGYIYSVAVRNKDRTLCYDATGLALYRLEVPVIRSAALSYAESGQWQIIISWNKVDAHGYEVQYSRDNGANWEKVSFTEDTYCIVDGSGSAEGIVFRVRCNKTNNDRGTTWSQYSSWKRPVVTGEN